MTLIRSLLPWLWLIGWTMAYSQEISWSVPHMKPEGDRSAVAEAWLGTRQGLTYLTLYGEDQLYVVQLDQEGKVQQTVTPSLEMHRKTGEYLYSALLTDRLLVLATTQRGTRVQISGRTFQLPELTPLTNWQLIESGPFQLAEAVGTTRTHAMTVSPDGTHFALLSATYPNPRIKGQTMIGLVVDSTLLVQKRHIMQIRPTDLLQEPDGFALGNDQRLLLYRLDRKKGHWIARSVPLEGEAQTVKIGEGSGHFLHSYLLKPDGDAWRLFGFYGKQAVPSHEGLFTTAIRLEDLTAHQLHFEEVKEKLPYRMKTDSRYSLDLQFLGYLPNYWFQNSDGTHYLVAEQRLFGGSNSSKQQQQVQTAIPTLFPTKQELLGGVAYQGLLVLALSKDWEVSDAQFIPRKGSNRVPIYLPPHWGTPPSSAQEVGVSYTAASHGDQLHLLFNEYEKEFGKPLSARNNPTRFRQMETSLMHWEWNKTSDPSVMTLFDNRATHIFLQPHRCLQLLPNQWWLLGTTESESQFFTGLLHW